MSVYNVTSPDGHVYSISNQDDAKAQEAAMQMANSFGPATSTIGATARGALDAIPFGVKGAAAAESALGSNSYDQNLSDIDKLIQADKQQHNVAHDVGEVAGTAAPFAIPGVGEALGAESIGGRAAVGAGLGALQAASNNRNPDAMGTDIAKGAGLGAVASPVIGALGDLVGKGLSSAGNSVMQDANANAVKSAGLNPSFLAGQTPEQMQSLGQMIRGSNLQSGTLADRLSRVTAFKQAAGIKLGEIGDKAATVSDTAPYTSKLSGLSEKYSSSGTPEAQSMGKVYAGGVHDIQNQLPSGSSYQDVQDLKEMYAPLAFNTDHSVKNQAAADVYGTLRNMQTDLANDSPDNVQKVMKTYSTLSDIQSGIKRQLGSERAGSANGGMSISGMVRQIPGMTNPLLAFPAAAAIGSVHPYLGAIVGVGALGNKGALASIEMGAQKGLQAAAEQAGSIAPVTTSGIANATFTPQFNHPAMAPYKPIFAAASQGMTDPSAIQKSNTITDFILSQRDPNYSQAKEAAAQAAQ